MRQMAAWINPLAFLDVDLPTAPTACRVPKVSWLSCVRLVLLRMFQRWFSAIKKSPLSQFLFRSFLRNNEF